MKHTANPEFWRLFYGLPVQVQKQARKQFQLLKTNPHHPSVQLKKVGKGWSARVSRVYRAVGTLERDTMVWHWIGAHAEYDDLIRHGH